MVRSIQVKKKKFGRKKIIIKIIDSQEKNSKIWFYSQARKHVYTVPGWTYVYFALCLHYAVIQEVII